MNGSIRKRGKTWSYRIDFGKTKDGKRNQIEKGGYKTKKEADKAMNDALFAINNDGEYVENKKIDFQTVYNEFIETEAKATRAYATLKRYDSLYRNHYKEVFGGLYIYQISSNLINKFINEKTTNYSEEYVKGLYKTLKVIIEFAHKQKYMKKNPFTNVTPPPDPRHIGEIKTYDENERRKMEERLQGTNVIVSYYICLNTGLRESEVFALRWEDVDFNNKKIKVSKQLLFQDVINRIKTMFELDVTVNKTIQDGHCSMNLFGKKVDCRLSLIPAIHGENIAIRILDQNKTPLDISRIGFSEENEELFKKLIKRPQGMILLTGPTGSGKSTSLYSGIAVSVEVQGMTTLLQYKSS